MSILNEWCRWCNKIVPWTEVTEGEAPRGIDHLVLRGSSHAELWDSSHAELWDSSHAVLWDSSHAVLWDSSHAELWGSSHAVLWGSSHADAYHPMAVIMRRSRVTKARGGYVIDTYVQSTDPYDWLRATQAAMLDERTAILYKRTAKDYSTRNGVRYIPGTTVEAPDWKPEPECGNGLHFCAHPAPCDTFRSGDGDRYVACAVAVADTVVHAEPDYPEKIKAARCVVLWECDRDGNRIAPPTAVQPGVVS